MLLVAAVIVGALVVAGPAHRIAGEAVRNVCRIAGGDCGTAPRPRSTGRRSSAPPRTSRRARRRRPGRRRAFFRALDPDVAEALAQERPELVGNTDGAPIRLRYRANAEAIRREIARLRSEGVPDDDARLRTLRELDDPDRHFLLFDPAGDGRAAEVFGDLGARATSRSWCRA